MLKTEKGEFIQIGTRHKELEEFHGGDYKIS